MLIKNMSNEYEIIHEIARSYGNIAYQCRFGVSGRQQECKVFKFLDTDKNKKLILLFNSLLVKGQWEDLIECFSQKDVLYVAVKYYEHETLIHKMKKDDYSLMGRTHIFLKLCETMLIQNAPAYIICDGLQKNHLLINDQLNIYMNYELEDIANYTAYSMKDVCRAVLFWLKKLFRRELKQKSSMQLELFKKNLQNQRFRSYMDIYTVYNEVEKELLQFDSKGLLYINHSLPYRIWEGIKNFFAKIKYMILIGLILITIVLSVLVWQRHGEKKEVPVNGVEFIGGVEVV